MAKLKTAPIVCGGVYERVLPSGRVTRAQIVACEESHEGVFEGFMARMNFPPLKVKEDDESMRDWTLIAIPHELAEPMVPEREETEVERLRRERDEARAQAQAAAHGDVTTQAVKLRKAGKSWGEIGRELGIHHNKAKALVEAAA